MKTLVGRVINSVRISKDRSIIEFNTDHGLIYYGAGSECCSTSWIEHFEYEGIEGSTVLNTIEKDVVYPGGDLCLFNTAYPDYQQEYDEAHFYDIVTTKGTFTIEMRNSSNGYYGGWLEHLETTRRYGLPSVARAEWN